MVASAVVLTLLAGVGFGQTKKKKKLSKKDPEYTETLDAPPDPPTAIPADSGRLIFLTSPLTNKGLLSQQVRDGLSALRKQARGAVIVKIRAFVAGRGDARRVTAIVSEQFTDWKLPLPVVGLLQVGALSLDGAQVALEAIAEDRGHTPNPHGLDWVEPQQSVKPLTETGSLAAVQPLVESVANEFRGEVVAVTCFLSSLEGIAGVDALLASRFPAASRTTVQAMRATGSGLARCEAIERRKAGTPDRVVLTGTQIGFRNEAKDLESLAGRMDKVLADNKAKPLARRVYVTQGALAKLAGSATIVEGVGANEATMSMEAVGVQP